MYSVGNISAPIWYRNYCDWLHRSELSSEELIVANLFKHFPTFYGNWKFTAMFTCPCHEPEESSPQSLYYLFKIHFNIILIYTDVKDVFLMISFLQVFLWKCCINYFSLPFVLHAIVIKLLYERSSCCQWCLSICMRNLSHFVKRLKKLPSCLCVITFFFFFSFRSM